MYRSINDFLADWKYESEGTAKVFSLVTSETSKEKIHENVRSLQRLAWHLTQTITEMGTRAGLLEQDTLEHEPAPESMDALIEVYNNYSTLLSRAVHLKWTDSSLSEKVPMYGEAWEKGKILRVLVSHQSHHRGQMTVIMRMLGLPVPGLYGPSKEEWVEMGMPAMD
nr:DinB family protein [uncultured Pedobacter sp.]